MFQVSAPGQRKRDAEAILGRTQDSMTRYAGWRMVAVGTSLPRREIVDEFQRLWYGEAVGSDHTYFGLRMPRCPLDMAIYAEVVHALRPGLIVETGTCEGASALHSRTCWTSSATARC